MGQALSRELTQRGYKLFLLGRDRSLLESCKNDLNTRQPGSCVGLAVCDLEDAESLAVAMSAAKSELVSVSHVILTAGRFATQDALEESEAEVFRLATVNFTNTLVFCELARKAMNNSGTLCVFSSVAGDRGRKPVIIYGATKAGLSHYLEGLDHKFKSEGLRVLTVKPGFVTTEMTEGLKPPPIVGDKTEVAVEVADALESNVSVLYTPKAWRVIMSVIKRLPRGVMRKVNF